MVDLSKRANLLGVREVRGLVLADAIGADWAPHVTLRAVDDASADSWTFTGQASIVDHPYSVRDMWGEFTETIAPGAFDKTLSENPNVMLNFMHDPATTMATTRSGLELTASPHLNVTATVSRDDVDAQRVMPKVARGDAASMSFAFRVMRQEWNDDYTDRRITEVDLNRGDVAVIVSGLGANPAAWGTVRSEGIARDRAERILRAATMDPTHLADLAELVCNAIDMTDDAFDTFLGALGIPDPDAAEDAAEEAAEMQQNSIDLDTSEVWYQLARLQLRARETSLFAH